MTDLFALENFEKFVEVDKAILVISIGTEFNGRYYKYIATIYPCEN